MDRGLCFHGDGMDAGFHVDFIGRTFGFGAAFRGLVVIQERQRAFILCDG
jgi:hypothetical protein